MAMGRAWVGAGAAAAFLAVAANGGADPARPVPIPIPPGGYQHAYPMMNVHDPVNVTHVQKLLARVPQKCGARQVAPNVWVKIDCHAYKVVPNAKPLIFSRGRVQLMQQGKLRLDPQAKVGGGAPPPPGGGGDAVPVAAASSFPSMVDHRQTGTEGPIKNQEYTSACTSFALSATMDNAILRLGSKDVSSPSHIWAHYGQPDMGDAASGNLNKPIATWATWPFSPKEGCELSRFEDDCDEHYGVSTNSYTRDAKLESELAAAEANGKYMIASVQALSMPANPNDLAAVLATGADLWVAFSLDANNWGYTALQQNNNVIPDWSEPEGGHAVMLAGYRVTSAGTKQFLIHNSWGTDWGDAGYAWVSETMVKRFLRSAYKIKVTPVGGAIAPVAALPLTDDDCDSDELVDAVTGQCSPECPDGSRPSKGVCSNSSSSGNSSASGTNAHPPKNGACPAGEVLIGGRCMIPIHF